MMTMSRSPILRVLRPALCAPVKLSITKRPAYSDFYLAFRRLNRVAVRNYITSNTDVVEDSVPSRRQEQTAEDSSRVVEYSVTKENVRNRIKELECADALLYPRISALEDQLISFKQFVAKYEKLVIESVPTEFVSNDIITMHGRVYNIREGGSRKARFFDIQSEGRLLQAKCRLDDMACSQDSHEKFFRLLKRGDIVSITGHPSKSSKDKHLGLRLTKLPQLLTPALSTLPLAINDQETLLKKPHADLLLHQERQVRLRHRASMLNELRSFLNDREFIEVQTPIISRTTGGATAEPFTTRATEFSDKELSLRIAPELWLKRLVIGGMDRVYEIGPVFRNEGVDATHNPEFTTCEFYMAYASLNNLMDMTETLLRGMALRTSELYEENAGQPQPVPYLDSFSPSFKRLEFIPAIEAATHHKLPDLSSPRATTSLIILFTSLSLPIPSYPTVPRLLDKLCSHYLEPQCDSPTFITHPPASLAPLAKSHTCPQTGQEVSLRAELYVGRREMANMYEEENSPLEQRRKLLEQVQWRYGVGGVEIDESYLEALDWGLPPTGGWGCGVDRLVGYFGGHKRIADVMSFGSLRNVVGIGSGLRR